MSMKAPFPYFGGKSRAASLVWPRFGYVKNYVEPFFGSGAMLLNRPLPFTGTETVNDADGMLANFWRALKADPAAVAEAADWPVNENDLHARHVWLVGMKESLQARLEGDPRYYDVQAAGWWVWGMACWIGSGFCSGRGPWQAVAAGDGSRQLVHLGNAGQGVNRKRVHLGGPTSRSDGDPGQESIEAMPAEGSTGNGSELLDYFEQLAKRLRRVRVCCGDWRRVCGGKSGNALKCLFAGGTPTAVFLDPPYAASAARTSDLYRIDSESVAHDVRDWAVEHGDDERLRIALCGYEGEHKMPRRWKAVAWKAAGGYAGQAVKKVNDNPRRERIWFSPHCLPIPEAKPCPRPA